MLQPERELPSIKRILLSFPELVLTAYPPEDLLLRPSIDRRIETALNKIKQAALPACLVIGYPCREQGKLYNSLAVIHGRANASRLTTKQCLPNYQVFDEKRYFEAGNKSCVLTIKGISVAFTICEDLWEAGPMQQAVKDGAQLMINIKRFALSPE